jgi:predicted nucleic acid-binding protein
MPGERFFDTNILIYAFTTGDRRCAPAESLLAEGGAIGVQVLNEFTNVARSKLRWDWPKVDAALEVIAELMEPARPLTTDIHTHAVKLARASAVSFYDALIIAAAAEAGCTLLFSEDMQHGRKFDGVTIRNPFLGERP